MARAGADKDVAAAITSWPNPSCHDAVRGTGTHLLPFAIEVSWFACAASSSGGRTTTARARCAAPRSRLCSTA